MTWSLHMKQKNMTPRLPSSSTTAFAEIQHGVESGTVLNVTLNKQVVDKADLQDCFPKA